MKRFFTALLLSLLFCSFASAESIVIYFSRADENYSVGTVEKGNTQVLAEIIASKTGSSLFHVERAASYPKDYNSCIKEAQNEQKKNARPELKMTMSQKDFDRYDTVYLGSPVWWGDLPMAMYTFIESLDWTGKTVYLFGTHEGSGANCLESGFKKVAKGCVLKGKVLSMYGHDAQKNDAKEREAVEKWLSK